MSLSNIKILQNIDISKLTVMGKGMVSNNITDDIIANYNPMNITKSIDWFFDTYPTGSIEKYFNVLSTLDYLVNVNSIFLKYKLLDINILKNSNGFIVVEYIYKLENN